VFLWLLRMLYYLDVLHWLRLGVHMNKEHQIGPKRAPDQIGPPVRTTKSNSYNFWFPEDMRAHEYLLEILLSLDSNPGNLTSFRLSNKKLSSKDSWLVRRSRVCSRIYLCSISSARLYHSTMFHYACGTFLESLSSLVSHPTNGSSFWLPSKE